jgi:hypothetical protein
VVVESRYNWYWLVDGPQAAGFVVHRANTTAIKKYDGLKRTGDQTDARYLAHLLPGSQTHATGAQPPLAPKPGSSMSARKRTLIR